MLKKLFVFLLLTVLLLWLGHRNLGKWLDLTEEPLKSDVIVSLGGGDWHRYKRSVELYEKGYARKRIMLLTGADVTAEMRRRGIPDGRITDLKKHHPGIAYLYAPELRSTREEVRYLRRFMKERGCTSALVVTDPPHSRRFALLWRLLGDGDATLHFVSSGVSWWERERYYDNATARHYAWTELLKIPYNLWMLMLEK